MDCGGGGKFGGQGRGEGGVQVEGHQEGGAGGERLEAGFVGLDGFDGRDGWDKIGHYVDGVDAAEGDSGCNGFHHGVVAEVDVEVGCSWKFNPVEES